MKKLLFIWLTLICSTRLVSQGAAGFVDDRLFFFTYMNGSVAKQEILKIDSFYPSTNYVAYIDRYGNFKFIHNQKKYTVYNVPPDVLKVSNHFMAYSRGPMLGVFNGKTSKTIEPFIRGAFYIGDSIVTYINNYDILKAYIADTTYDLLTFAQPEMHRTGDNIVAFKTLDERFKAFYRGQIFDLEPYMPSDYAIARDMVVYHDNISNFKIFEKGETYTLESYQIDSFRLTNNILTYYSNVGEWFAYSNAEKKLLLNTRPKSFIQKRNILAYTDNAGNFYAYYKGRVLQLENYTPDKMDAWEDLLVYTDLYGALWGLVKGVKMKISEGIVKEWWLQNQCVVYWDLTPNIKSVWNQGKIYRYSVDQDPTRN